MVAEVVARLVGGLIVASGGWRLGEYISEVWGAELYVPWVFGLTFAGFAIGLIGTPYITVRSAQRLVAHDVTSRVAVPEGAPARARLVAKEAGVLAGLDVFARVFELCDPGAEVRLAAADGDVVEPGREVAVVEGGARALLLAERTALNLLQRLSGCATKTARCVALLRDLPGPVGETNGGICIQSWKERKLRRSRLGDFKFQQEKVNRKKALTKQVMSHFQKIFNWKTYIFTVTAVITFSNFMVLRLDAGSPDQ